MNHHVPAPLPTAALPSPVDKAPRILRAAEMILPALAAGRAIGAAVVRSTMDDAFGGADAEGAWLWKDAYEACEVAQVLFFRRYGPAMRRQATTPARLLAMLSRVAGLLPTQTRRSDESQAYQQFSTPIPLGFVAAITAALVQGDVVLEPSAGTGMLAILAERDGVVLALNELASVRADLLSLLFPGVAVTRHDAAQIDDRLDGAVRPGVVLMNPPFSVAAHVEGKVRDAAFRHMSSALARLADGGRLVAITGAGLSPDAPQWREAFIALQESGRVVFSAPINGGVYAPHGTTIETRLTVIDKV